MQPFPIPCMRVLQEQNLKSEESRRQNVMAYNESTDSMSRTWKTLPSVLIRWLDAAG